MGCKQNLLEVESVDALRSRTNRGPSRVSSNGGALDLWGDKSELDMRLLEMEER